MDTLLQDVRYALRSVARSPGFAVIAVLTLAIGVGANAAIFSVVDGVLLRPLPYVQPERLVAVAPQFGFLPGEFEILREECRSYAGLAGYRPNVGMSLAGAGEPERLTAASVSANLFNTLGATPLVGRTFIESEDRPGRGSVVVLSHDLWRRRFGEDPGVIGRRIRLDGRPFTVIGVMPPGFSFPTADTELWVPFTFDRANVGAYWGTGGFRAIGRLVPGATPEQARGELVALSRQRLRLENPLWTPLEDYRAAATVVPLRDAIVGDVRPMLLVLLGAVGFVLLIACANVANLLLARAVGRERELAVRTALGAGRRRLLRQLLTESLVLAVAGGAAGVLVAFWSIAFLLPALPAHIPRVESVAVDGRVLGFALIAALVTGAAFGLLPAWRASRAEPQVALREGRGPGGSAGRRRLSSALVAAEVALAVVLATGAGLLIRSFLQLRSVDPGFRTERVLTARVSSAEAEYPDAEGRRLFYREVLERAAAVPGVTAVAATSQLPFDGRPLGFALYLENVTQDPNDLPTFDHRAITPDYFRVLDIPLVGGRTFDDRDRADSPLVAVVDEVAANRFWPGEDPVGRRLRYPWRGAPWITVVGVVGGVRNNDLAAERPPAVYVPFAQRPDAVMTLVARATVRPEALASALRTVVAAVDPNVPVEDVRTLDGLLADSVAQPRFTMLLLGAFAAVALLLGAIGIYGVLSHAVGQRTREIGLRMALGASAGGVLRLVVRQALTMAIVGLALGVAAAFALTRALRGMLYEVSPTDPLTFAAVPAVLAVIALFAAYLPARRAAAVDPMVALRAD